MASTVSLGEMFHNFTLKLENISDTQTFGEVKVRFQCTSTSALCSDSAEAAGSSRQYPIRSFLTAKVNLRSSSPSPRKRYSK